MRKVLFLVLVLFSVRAYGQQNPVSPSIVVAACGNQTYTAGQVRQTTIDLTGQTCINGTITGGNAAASNTGAAVPAAASYTGINVAGTLRGWTGAARGSEFAGSVQIVDGSGNQITSFGTSGATGAAVPANAAYMAVNVGGVLTGVTGTSTSMNVNCTGGCSAGTSDADDGSVATGQTAALSLPLNYVFDGTVWRRQTIGVAGTAAAQVVTIQGIASMTAVATSVANGSNVLLGTTTDAKSTATDGTSITAMQVWKQISASVQAPPSQAVTNVGTFATQSAVTAASGAYASGSIASGAIASGALAVGAGTNGWDVAEGTTIVDRCTTTDTTACTVVGLLKQNNFLMGTPTGQQTMANSNAVAIASNQSAIAAWGQGATSAAVPAGATYMGVQNSAGLSGAIHCNNYAQDRSTTADVQLVAISGSTTIYICGYAITGESTTTSDVNLRTATNSNCTSGAGNVTPPITVGTSTSGGMIGGIAVPPGAWMGLKATASQNLCVHRSAVQTSEVQVWYTQF